MTPFLGQRAVEWARRKWSPHVKKKGRESLQSCLGGFPQFFSLAAGVEDRRLVGSGYCLSATSTPSSLCGVDTTSPIPNWHLLPSWASSCSQRGEAGFSTPSASLRGPVAGSVQTTARGPVTPAPASSQLWPRLREGAVCCCLRPVARPSVCLLRNYYFLSTLCQALL